MIWNIIMIKNRKRRNVMQYVSYREINEEICGIFQDRLHVTDTFINRLGLEAELEGHDGCVNCLEWSDTGRYLASGSDDTKVILWDPFHKKLLCTYSTLHQGNIFSVKFLPQSSDTKIVTGAADHEILALDLVSKETFYVCTCPAHRVKRIATSPDSPYVFWSASEDGYIRQTDLRVRHVCDNEALNVLINLKNHQGALAEGKCIAINPFRTEMMAVGSNDPFIRIYDRRMIKLTTVYESSKWYDQMMGEQESSSANCTDSDLEIPWKVTDNIINGCVQYFVAGHLSGGHNCSKLRYPTITYLSFSPDGHHLLANLGSEQVYLFDVTKKHVPKYFAIPSVMHKTSQYSNGVTNHSIRDFLPEVIEQLKLKANECFKKNEFHQAIRLYNKAIEQYGSNAVLYGNRAAAFMKRAWRGDMYAAARDCRIALQLDPDYMKAFFRLARCFYELKRTEEAKACLNQFKIKFTSQAESHACRALEKDIDTAYKKTQSDKSKKNSKTNRGDRQMLVSLHLDGIYVSDTNLELQLSNPEKLWRSNARDYENRYCGHCNVVTDIKEANFFGRDGQYIVAGSDDGHFFIWDRYSENNICIRKGDRIVNCLQPHPSYCLLATSGIDTVVRLWSPLPEDIKRTPEDLDSVADINYKRLKRHSSGAHLLDDVPFSHSDTLSDDSSHDESPLPCRPS